MGGGSAALSRKLHGHGAGDLAPSSPGGAGLSASNVASGSYNAYSDVPERALQPKVFVPHARQAGTNAVPRRVAVERKRREFAAVTEAVGAGGLESLLRGHGVDYAVPGGDAIAASAPSTPQAGTADYAATLPLEAFDSSEFEIRPPADWVALGVDEATGQQRGVPGLALFMQPDGSGYWRSCRAVAWDASTASFTVVWTDASNGKTRSNLQSHIAAARSMDDEESKEAAESKEGEAKATAEWAAVISGATGIGSAKRIHMCFAAEDPNNFANRLAAAFKSRREAAQLLRYHLYVDCMPTEDGPQLQPVQVDRVSRLATAARSLAAATAVNPIGRDARDRGAALTTALQALLGEAQTDFARTMNKIIFDKTVSAVRGHADAAATSATGQSLPTDLGLLAAVDVPPPAASKPVPEVGLMRIPPHDFGGCTDAFNFQTLYSKDEVIALLQRVGGENAKVWHKGPAAATNGMLVGQPGKPQKLDEFDGANNSATAQYASYLREGWAQVIRNHVRHCLGNVGKGHFNLKESNAKAYEYSKLRRLLRLVGYKMADELRYSTDAQLHDFTASISAACEVNVGITNPSTVTVTTSAGGMFKRTPLFAIDVTIHEVPLNPPAAAGGDGKDAVAAKKAPEPIKKPAPGAAGKKDKAAPTGPTKKIFGYSVSVPALAAAPVAAFDRALKAIAGVTAVERQVMDRLFWPEEPLIPVVHPLEPHVAAMRDKMTAALSKATHPLDQYISTLDPYLPFLQLDVEDMVEQLKQRFAANGFSVPDCKAAIQKARDAAQSLLDELPVTINLGLALVSVSDVRAFLIKKQQHVAESVLKLVAHNASEMSTDIIKCYDHMIKSLSASTSDIESLTTLKEFMAACPDKIREQQVRADANGQSYSLLEQYAFPLPKDQFDLQWKAMGGPARVYKKIAEVEAALEKEKTRYMDEMAAEQVEFEDSLVGLSDEVTALTRFTKMEDTEVASSTVSKLKASLDAAEEKARLFNAREGLFNKEITNYDKIGEIKKAFEPYFSLWDTTASWQRQHKSWMTDAFMNLNAEYIEREAGAGEFSCAGC